LSSSFPFGTGSLLDLHFVEDGVECGKASLPVLAERSGPQHWFLRALIEREPEADLVSNAKLVADDIDNIRPDRMGSGRYWRARAALGGRTEELWIRRFASFPRDEETSCSSRRSPRRLKGSRSMT
jgi:hypothetical protein